MILYDFLCYALLFSIYRFQNENVEDCWDYKLVKDFRKLTFLFMEDYCLETPGFLRETGKDRDLKAEHVKIDNGLIDFLKIDNCKKIIGPLFKRFLTSFQEPVITSTIADHMRSIEGKA